MRRKARPGGGRQVETTIEAIGARGDGVARLQGRPLFVPLTVAGDRVRVRVVGEGAGGYRGELLELIAEGPGRCAPPCAHFGLCGGCSLQHLRDGFYAAWMRGLVLKALERKALPGECVGELVRIPPGTRRRATLAARRQAGRLHLGFHEPHSSRVVDLAECHLLTPALWRLIGPLRGALGPLVGGAELWDLTASETDTGIDLLLRVPRPADLRDREALAELAETADLARLSWQGPEGPPEPVVQRRAPEVRFGQVAVAPPPGGFLQPSREGEAALAGLVLSHVPAEAKRAADLFSGCGTFAFRLAERCRVHAVDGDADAVRALESAARRAGLESRLTAERRDLTRRPLLAAELDGFDALVFDPPRAGARAQAQQLAAARVPMVVAVSCNPATFARDARTLVEGGYRLTALTPVDQFPWSGHVELVAAFAR